MSKKLLVLFSLLAASTLVALAADVTGKWVAQVPGREGQTREQVINLKADGDKVSGTMSGFRGETPITDGKVDGDKVTWTQKMTMGDNTMEFKFTGTVNGDEMKVVREGGRGPQEFTAKRSK